MFTLFKRSATSTTPLFDIDEHVSDLNFYGCASIITKRWYDEEEKRWYYHLLGFQGDYAEDEIHRNGFMDILPGDIKDLTRMRVIMYRQRKDRLYGEEARDERRRLLALADAEFWPWAKDWLKANAHPGYIKAYWPKESNESC